MHELHPHKVSTPSLPLLQPPTTISHLRSSTCPPGHPPTDPRQPSVISFSILPLLEPSTAASDASFLLHHSLPAHHASALHAASHPCSPSDQPAHTCPASAPTHPSSLGLSHWSLASSSTGTTSRTSPSTCPPTASPWPVELWRQTGV